MRANPNLTFSVQSATPPSTFSFLPGQCYPVFAEHDAHATPRPRPIRNPTLHGASCALSLQVGSDNLDPILAVHGWREYYHLSSPARRRRCNTRRLLADETNGEAKGGQARRKGELSYRRGGKVIWARCSFAVRVGGYGTVPLLWSTCPIHPNPITLASPRLAYTLLRNS